MSGEAINPRRLEERVDALDEPALRALASKLAEHLRFVTPVNPHTKRGLALLAAYEEGDADLTDALEALRDELDEEYFQLDAENDEEARSIFQQARAIGALINGLKSVYADAVYEAMHTSDEPATTLRDLGLAALLEEQP